MKHGKKIVLFTLFAMNVIDQPAPEVEIEQGILSGKISPDGSFFEYVGIPYATTNSSTRFKAPLPPPKWKGTFKAIEETAICPQISTIGVTGTEDCLKINVYVPAFAVRPLPVMVYIHGGAFILGSGSKLLYAPDFLMKHDVILVTFMYRLGALGFTCLKTKDAPGNAGLKDQIAALKWVKKNIASFGGDPDNITLFGQSAGGASTSALIASPITKGLFHKAIVQSGSSIANWGINRDPVWIASLLAKDLGYDVTSPKDIYDVLSKVSYKDLTKAKPKKPLGKYLDTELLHLPCIEDVIEGEEAVLDDLPYNLFKKYPKNIPLIYGSTSKEGLFLIAADTKETLEERDKRYLYASDLIFPSEEVAEEEDKKARKLYFGDKEMNMNTIMNVSVLFTDLYFGMPVILESELLLGKSAPTYNYHFNYEGGRNFLKYLTGYKNESGACHADEVLYIFRGNMWPFRINEKDQIMIDWMTKMWTNFAKYGNPTPEGQKDIPVQWVPSKPNELKFLYIEQELKMGPIPNPETYKFWKKKIVLFTLFAMNVIDQPAPEVEIEQGILSGKISPDGSFFEYVGIPYATTNSSTRFKAPLPPPKWKGTFKAIEETAICPQISTIGVTGTEDCLKINVYVPAFAVRPLPVMVYIHGGAFILGSGSKLLYAPDFLMKHDVILVTFMYRLGALGFTCLKTKDAPGNAGLKDQIAALKWVKKNIASFGGDPDNITLFGQSAGGASTSALIASPVTKGLFHKAIVQSGSSIANWSINRDPVWIASLLAKDLGYDVTTPKDIYDVLSKVSYKDLTKAKPKKPLGKYLDLELLHLPCVEDVIEGEKAVLDDLPYNLFKKYPKNIPLIYGSTSKEGLFLIAADTKETLEERDKRYLYASDLIFPSEEVAEEEDKKARKLYFGDKEINMNTVMNVSVLFTDLYFEMPVILESELLLGKSAPTYNYYFNYEGGRNFLKYLTGYKNESGACHADEILYIFRGNMWPFRINQKDQKMIDWMTKMWTNFAKYGNPTPEGQKDIPVQWVPSKPNELKFLYIEEELKMGPIPNPETYKFWKYMYDKYRRTDLKGFKSI
ncbi:hypothetical protein K1T71_004240 [Dendrolimus kikuchii]|uniref:Uncharacterized protein n=1 Tax=Dendrolimus kikuchii TaxID=765133 RepID=A0ACC1D7C8_9NEOP|nr:hypothetical protein K1T71_004240 [Dendrolimus kikuchii]